MLVPDDARLAKMSNIIAQGEVTLKLWLVMATSHLLGYIYLWS